MAFRWDKVKKKVESNLPPGYCNDRFSFSLNVKTSMSSVIFALFGLFFIGYAVFNSFPASWSQGVWLFLLKWVILLVFLFFYGMYVIGIYVTSGRNKPPQSRGKDHKFQGGVTGGYIVPSFNPDREREHFQRVCDFILKRRAAYLGIKPPDDFQSSLAKLKKYADELGIDLCKALEALIRESRAA